jgi:hypothetical protein
MSRLWVMGIPIFVLINGEGMPAFLVWRSKNHPITTIANHWRVDRGWWHLRIARDYFVVATASGLLAVIFQDLITHDWYLQRLYD